MPTIAQVLEFFKWIGPTPAVLILMIGLMAKGMQLMFKYFERRDDQKRDDLKALYASMAELIKTTNDARVLNAVALDNLRMTLTMKVH